MTEHSADPPVSTTDGRPRYTTIDYTVADLILTITLNRPDHLNAFTPSMAEELVSAFERASSDDAVRAIVVTGSGRAFCAGMDLSGTGNAFGLDEDLSPSPDDLQNRLDDPTIRHGVRDTGGVVTLAIFDCTKPVIAAINGPAIGVGATMTLAMDVRLASENARVGFVFGRLGITQEACSSWFLPRIVGLSRALELVYSAEVLSASDALAAGLVKDVLPADELLDAAYALARSFTVNRSPTATALTRQMMYGLSGLAHPIEAHRFESLAMFYLSQTDGREGVNAFREKRTPSFARVISTPYWPLGDRDTGPNPG